MIKRIPAAIVTSCCLLASPAMTGAGSAADTCADEISYLTEFMESADEKKAEFEKEAAAGVDHPLNLTMADGSTVDLRGDAPAAKPFENWFGENIKIKDVDVRIENARTLAEEQSDDACLNDLERIEKWFNVARGSDPAR